MPDQLGDIRFLAAPHFALTMGLGSVIGALIGGLLVGLVAAAILKIALGIILIISAVRIFQHTKA